jgi:3',5'-cyclic AMP phosphodiesterase CpdA
MITRRKFLTTAAASTAASALHPSLSAQAANSEKPLFSVGLIADAQYADADPGGIRYFRNSIGKLGAAAKAINEAQVDFSIHLGDLIDHDFSSFDDILEPLRTLEQPVHQVLGNHDFSVAEDKKSEVPAKMGIKNTYYAFSKSKIRFIFLDGTEISTFAQPEGSPIHEQATAILAEFKAEKRKNARNWNSAIGAEQFTWLEKQLAAAAKGGEKAIISCHYPILPDNVHNLWNDRELLALIDLHSDTVVAWLNGHNHAGNYAERKGVHYLTVHGMVDTKDSNAYAVLDVLPSALRIRGGGRVPDRLLPFS